MRGFLESYLPFGLTIEAVISLMAGLAAFLAVLAIWHTGIVPGPMARRLRTLSRHRADLKASSLAARRRPPLIVSYGLMNDIVERLKLLKSREAEKIARKLQQAGWRSREALVIYLFFKLTLPLALGIAGAVLFYGFDLFALSDFMKLAASLGLVLAGAYAPDIYVKNAVIKRIDAIRKALPDAIDLLVICAEAGLSVDAALNRVAEEVVQTYPEIADEFSLTSIELGFLPNRAIALHNLARRVDLPALRGVVTTFIQTERYGTPLAQSLRVLAAEFRNERLMRAEEKAARLPATLTLPLVVFILPPLFIVLIGPAALKTIDALMSL